ncbi:MAG: hypothetical protein HOQ45_24425 [Nocardioidaceae bacterium]|nr:hypothetical protein [Nocardioidaceae bacterium]
MRVGRTTTILTGLVVALLLALAGTSAAPASAAPGDHASAVSPHRAHLVATPALPHRLSVPHRHHDLPAAAPVADLLLRLATARPDAARSAHGPVLESGVCSRDRAPPV